MLHVLKWYLEWFGKAEPKLFLEHDMIGTKNSLFDADPGEQAVIFWTLSPHD
jgi:hypothetical protein